MIDKTTGFRIRCINTAVKILIGDGTNLILPTPALINLKKLFLKFWNRLFSHLPDKPIGEPSTPVNVSDIPTDSVGPVTVTFTFPEGVDLKAETRYHLIYQLPNNETIAMLFHSARPGKTTKIVTRIGQYGETGPIVAQIYSDKRRLNFWDCLKKKSTKSS